MNIDTFSKQLLAYVEAEEALQGDEVALLLNELTAREVEEGGPYHNEEGVHEIDSGLNLAIACVLFGLGVSLPKLNAYVETALAAGEHGTVYDEATFATLLACYQRGVKEEPTATPTTRSAEEQAMMERILAVFDQRFVSFEHEVLERARAVIEKTIRGNSDQQMSLMAYFTRAALKEGEEAIPDETIALMGLANIFFWTAFIIYDDFWDEDEAADPKLLPIANTFARHYVDYFSNLLPEETGFRAWFESTMDALDGANAWETEYCRARVVGSTFHIPERLPEYGAYERKFLPAAGHLAGPVGLMVMQGYAIDSPEVVAFTNYARHYLIAMQLNDDAHDWEEDMARGHLSTVVALMLEDWKKTHEENSTIDLVADLPELKKLFWFTTIPRYSAQALEHSQKAEQALASLQNVFADPQPLAQFPQKTAAIAAKAKQDHGDVDKLLGALVA